MTLLFLKRLNDRFEERVEELVGQGRSEKEANLEFYHDFFVPDDAKWGNLQGVRRKVGGKIDELCKKIETANPRLDGVLTNTKYSDPRKYPDDQLANLVSHFNEPRLRNSDLEKEDIFGDAYEYLLEQFADATKKKGGRVLYAARGGQSPGEYSGPKGGNAHMRSHMRLGRHADRVPQVRRAAKRRSQKSGS